MNRGMETFVARSDCRDVHCPILEPPATCDYLALSKCGYQKIKDGECDCTCSRHHTQTVWVCTVAQTATVCTNCKTEQRTFPQRSFCWKQLEYFPSPLLIFIYPNNELFPEDRAEIGVQAWRSLLTVQDIGKFAVRDKRVLIAVHMLKMALTIYSIIPAVREPGRMVRQELCCIKHCT